MIILEKEINRMDLNINHLIFQYDQVKASRQVLIAYCESISSEDFIKTDTVFGKGSIRNLLVHIANCYEYWIGNCCLKNDISPTSYNAVKTIKDALEIFEQVDKMMSDFFESPVLSSKIITIERPEETLNEIPLKLLTHVITHEFHHKGQIMTLSRLLGYIPVDTDIMR